MKHKKYLLSLFFIFIFLIGVSCVSADEPCSSITDESKKNTCIKCEKSCPKSSATAYNECYKSCQNNAGQSQAKDPNAIKKESTKICIYANGNNNISFQIYSDIDGSNKYKYIKMISANGSTGSLSATNVSNWSENDDINKFSGREHLLSTGKCPKRFVTCASSIPNNASWFAYSKATVKSIQDSNACGMSHQVIMLTRNDKAIEAVEKMMKVAEVFTDAALEEFVSDSIEENDIEVVCGMLTKNAQDFIYRILDWIKYIALILTVALSILDFFKAMSSEEDDSFKKAASKLAKRIIVVVILFLLPVLLEFVLKLTHIQGVDSGNPLCM